MTPNDRHTKGTCTKMCPDSEVILREREGLLHKFEVLPENNLSGHPKADYTKVVKKYSRSAAGQTPPKPNELRTPDALKNTILYLFKEIVSKDTDWNIVYNFVFDRLCAVRQDAVIQDLNVQHSIDILQPIVRFLAYSGYRMCEEPLHNYDPAINFHHFTDCLKKLLNLYDHQNSYESKKVKDVSSIAERSQFEAMYQITFLGNAEAIYRGITLEKELRTPLVNLAIEISFAHYGGNYVRVFRKIKDLPPLLLCVVALQLPKIRRFAFLVMSAAFNSRNLQYPLFSLVNLLLFDSDTLLLKECDNYGIQVKDQLVLFQKGTFKEQAPVVAPTWLKFINEALTKFDLSSLLLKCK